MSLIRDLLNIEEPKEYRVKSAIIHPPELLTEEYIVTLFSNDNKIVTLKPVKVTLKDVRVKSILDKKMVSARITEGNGCLLRLKLEFIGDAIAVYDRGHLVFKSSR